jgi:hypothetical protein
VKEGHQSGILTPTSVAFGWVDDLALGQSFRLHLQIDLGINVRRVERDVAKPATDGVNVHSGAKQVCRRGMANRVRADSFGGQRRDRAL